MVVGSPYTAAVDEKMRDIGAKTKSTGERLAVMTALNLAHELLSIKLPGGFDMQELRRRIGGMQARLDEARADALELARVALLERVDRVARGVAERAQTVEDRLVEAEVLREVRVGVERVHVAREAVKQRADHEYRDDYQGKADQHGVLLEAKGKGRALPLHRSAMCRRSIADMVEGRNTRWHPAISPCAGWRVQGLNGSYSRTMLSVSPSNSAVGTAA